MNDDIQIDPARPEAGPMLREARERRGMSLNEAADALHLKPELIQALEEERTEVLPSRTFVRGYLRNYARLVGLDENEVLNAYQGRLPEEAPPPLVGPGVKLRRRRDLGPWLYILLAFIIAAGAFYLWGGSDNASDEAPEAAQSPAVTQPRTDSPARVSEPVSAETSSAIEAEPQADVAADNGFETTEGETTEAGTIETEAFAASEQGPAATDAPMLATPAPEMPLPSSPVSAPAPVAEQAPQASAGAPAAAGGQLSLSIESESWVEITDGAGARRFAGLVQGPRVLTYEGPEPFSLVIGNAASAELRFDGQPVDLAPHTRGKVARLTVPQ